MGPQLLPNNVADNSEWAHRSTGVDNTASAPQPLPKHPDGPIDLLTEMADDFVWAQNFFGESCRTT
jgi:hypothetical protein